MIRNDAKIAGFAEDQELLWTGYRDRQTFTPLPTHTTVDERVRLTKPSAKEEAGHYVLSKVLPIFETDWLQLRTGV